MKKFVPNKEPILLSNGSKIINGEYISYINEGKREYISLDDFEKGFYELTDIIDKKLIVEE